MPQADSRDLRDRSLVVVVRDAKAAEQIADSISFTWRASVQRKPTAAKGRLLEVQLEFLGLYFSVFRYRSPE